LYRILRHNDPTVEHDSDLLHYISELLTHHRDFRACVRQLERLNNELHDTVTTCEQELVVARNAQRDANSRAMSLQTMHETLIRAHERLQKETDATGENREINEQTTDITITGSSSESNVPRNATGSHDVIYKPSRTGNKRRRLNDSDDTANADNEALDGRTELSECKRTLRETLNRLAETRDEQMAHAERCALTNEQLLMYSRLYENTRESLERAREHYAEKESTASIGAEIVVRLLERIRDGEPTTFDDAISREPTHTLSESAVGVPTQAHNESETSHHQFTFLSEAFHADVAPPCNYCPRINASVQPSATADWPEDANVNNSSADMSGASDLPSRIQSATADVARRSTTPTPRSNDAWSSGSFYNQPDSGPHGTGVPLLIPTTEAPQCPPDDTATRNVAASRVSLSGALSSFSANASPSPFPQLTFYENANGDTVMTDTGGLVDRFICAPDSVNSGDSNFGYIDVDPAAFSYIDPI